VRRADPDDASVKIRNGTMKLSNIFLTSTIFFSLQCLRGLFARVAPIKRRRMRRNSLTACRATRINAYTSDNLDENILIPPRIALSLTHSLPLSLCYCLCMRSARTCSRTLLTRTCVDEMSYATEECLHVVAAPTENDVTSKWWRPGSRRSPINRARCCHGSVGDFNALNPQLVCLLQNARIRLCVHWSIRAATLRWLQWHQCYIGRRKCCPYTASRLVTTRSYYRLNRVGLLDFGCIQSNPTGRNWYDKTFKTHGFTGSTSGGQIQSD
jgi:hypothetical protein